jgi:hypothetical protein
MDDGGGKIATRIIAQSGRKGTIKMKNERMKNEKLLKEGCFFVRGHQKAGHFCRMRSKNGLLKGACLRLDAADAGGR